MRIELKTFAAAESGGTIAEVRLRFEDRARALEAPAIGGGHRPRRGGSRSGPAARADPRRSQGPRGRVQRAGAFPPLRGRDSRPRARAGGRRRQARPVPLRRGRPPVIALLLLLAQDEALLKDLEGADIPRAYRALETLAAGSPDARAALGARAAASSGRLKSHLALAARGPVASARRITLAGPPRGVLEWAQELARRTDLPLNWDAAGRPKAPRGRARGARRPPVRGAGGAGPRGGSGGVVGGRPDPALHRRLRRRAGEPLRVHAAHPRPLQAGTGRGIRGALPRVRRSWRPRSRSSLRCRFSTSSAPASWRRATTRARTCSRLPGRRRSVRSPASSPAPRP